MFEVLNRNPCSCACFFSFLNTYYVQFYLFLNKLVINCGCTGPSLLGSGFLSWCAGLTLVDCLVGMGSCGISLGQGSNPCSLHWQVGFLTTGTTKEVLFVYFNKKYSLGIFIMLHALNNIGYLLFKPTNYGLLWFLFCFVVSWKECWVMIISVGRIEQ